MSGDAVPEPGPPTCWEVVVAVVAVDGAGGCCEDSGATGAAVVLGGGGTYGGIFTYIPAVPMIQPVGALTVGWNT